MLDRGWDTWFAPLVAVGEVLAGVALIIGTLTAVAAAVGLLRNTAFMLAGTDSTNPVLGVISILIILGWKVAGAWGIDCYFLPALETRGHPAGC
jgi:thiosulfate dehydrogenase (quinone) large subunit